MSRGDLPARVVGKIGAMHTKLLILKGRQQEAKEQGTEFDTKLVKDAEKALKEVLRLADELVKRRKVG